MLTNSTTILPGGTLKIKSRKRDDETFSEAIERLTSDYSLLDLAGGMSDEDAERHRELLEHSEAAAEDCHRR